MQFGVLGDVHGDFEAVRRIQAAHPGVRLWLCVGDLADDKGRYEPLASPVYWIKGNNEDFDRIAAGSFPENVLHIPNAVPVTLLGLTVAGLGGTLAPTWYDTPAAALPYPQRPGGPAVRDDKRRHFVREEVETCKRLQGVDVFMSHEAPRPFFISRPGGRGNDAGKTPINEVLGAMRPRLHLFGHHHRFTDQVRQGVRSVGLDLVSKSYLLVDAESLEFTRMDVG